MAYLVCKGTKIVVRKPSGKVARHACQNDCLFHAFEKISEHKTIQFSRDGFVISVRAADVAEIRYKCPECGVGTEIEGCARLPAEVVAGAVIVVSGSGGGQTDPLGPDQRGADRREVDLRQGHGLLPRDDFALQLRPAVTTEFHFQLQAAVNDGAELIAAGQIVVVLIGWGDSCWRCLSSGPCWTRRR